jgi:hypothetical protein
MTRPGVTRGSVSSERELQAAVLELAKFLGWRVHHVATSRALRDGMAFMTAQQGHRGFPDLVLLRPPRLVFAELKSKRGQVHFDQATWLNGLEAVPNVEQYLWRPIDWQAGRIEEVLR